MNLHQLLNGLWSRRWLAIGLLVITVAVVVGVSLLLPKEYIATTRLMADRHSTDPITGAVLPFQLHREYMATQIDVISSENVALRVVDSLQLTDNKELRSKLEAANYRGDIRNGLAEYLLKNLEVQPLRESSVIQLNFSSTDPQFSALVANAFAEGYSQAIFEIRAEPAEKNVEWFNKQMQIARQRLEKAQGRLTAYQQEHGLVMADGRLDLEYARLADLSRQLVESEARTYELVAKKNQFDARAAKGLSYDAQEAVLNSQLIQALKSELARAEGKFADTAMRFDKNHPQYRQAHAEVTSLQNKIRTEMKTIIEGISDASASSQGRDQKLTQALAEQKDRVLRLIEQRHKLALLSQEKDSAQVAYDNAMQIFAQGVLKSEARSSNVSVLSVATPPIKPSKPKIKFNILLSIFLGGVLGTGAALLAELIDRRVRSPLDFSDSLGLPVLGVIAAPGLSKSRWIALRRN